jgi:hypothetical protein
MVTRIEFGIGKRLGKHQDLGRRGVVHSLSPTPPHLNNPRSPGKRGMSTMNCLMLLWEAITTYLHSLRRYGGRVAAYNY